MTTLAFDGKVLATDSQCTQNDAIMLADTKKIYQPGEGEYWEIQGNKILAFALCGNPDALPYVIEGLNEGVTHRTRIAGPEMLDFVIIAVDEDGLAWYWGADVNPRRQFPIWTLGPQSGPVSAGSGQTIAHAVMSVTGSAVKAIEQAIRLDIYTGGEIQTWEFPGKPAVKSTRPAPAAQAPAVDPMTVMSRAEVDALFAKHFALAQQNTPAPVESSGEAEKVAEHA